MTLGLKNRMALAFAVMLVLMLSITAVGWWQTRGLGSQLERIVSGHNQRADLAHRLEAAQLDWTGQMRSLIVYSEVDDLKAQEAVVKTARERYLAAESALAQVLQRTSDASLQQQIARVREHREGVETPLAMVMRTAMSGAGAETALAVLASTERAEQEWRREVAAIVLAATAANQAEYEAGRARQAWPEFLFLLLSAAAAVLGMVMAVGLTRSVTGPVDRAVRAAERIADGDLGVRVESGYSHEMGRLFAAIGTMQERLRGTVSGLRSTAETMDGASAGIGAASKDLSERTEAAAAQLQQTTASLHELTDAVLQWSGTARQASASADTARGDASNGGAAMARIDERMQGINTASARIADIVGVIDSIAFQTNVLALNASVEAAHAGDRGRGFGVVAVEVEVRSLAQRAAEAARQIRALSQDVVRSVDEAKLSVADAAGTVTRLMEAAREVASVVQDIAGAADRHQGTLLETRQAIGRLDEVTQQNAVLAEELAASTTALSENSRQLTTALDGFRLEERADEAREGPRESQPPAAPAGAPALAAPAAT